MAVQFFYESDADSDRAYVAMITPNLCLRTLTCKITFVVET